MDAAKGVVMKNFERELARFQAERKGKKKGVVGPPPVHFALKTLKETDKVIFAPGASNIVLAAVSTCRGLQGFLRTIFEDSG